MTTPSVTIIGPGAIGCVTAAALIESGTRPTLLGRTTFDQLVVDHPNGEISASVDVVTDQASLRTADVVILATKANQIPDVSVALGTTTGPGTIVVVVQNGLEHEGRVLRYIHAEAVVLPSVVFVPASRSAPGHVEVTGPPSLTLPDGAAAGAIGQLFEGSFLTIHRSDDWLTDGWKKLIINAGLGAVGVLVRKDNETTLNDPDGYELIRSVMEEILPVARAEGARIDDDFPEKILVSVQERGGGSHMSSIVVDRVNGQPTEWQERNEHVSVIGKRHGIETPLNDLCTLLIRLGEPG